MTVGAFSKHFVSPQVSTVWRDPRLQIQYRAHLEAFVQPATTVQRAVVCPLPAQLALTKMRLQERVKMTVNHARSVKHEKLTWLCVHFPSSSPKMSQLFECFHQAGFRSYRARKHVILALLASTVSPWVPALCPARLVTSVPQRVQTVSLSPAPKGPTAPVKVSPPLVKSQNLFSHIIIKRC